MYLSTRIVSILLFYSSAKGGFASNSRVTMSSVMQQTRGLFRGSSTAVASEISDKIFCITGGYSGIGAETVRALLKAGARTIIVGGRNAKLQQEFVELLRKDFAEKVDGVVDASHTIDLADLQSVKDFALYIQSKYPVLDVLICNAGIMNTPPGVTKQGLEQQMGVNVVGHFLLAKILVEQTKRQVWVASYGHTLKGGKRIDLDFVKNFSIDNYEGCDGWVAYQ
jgi:NAD(P)-dependent dehydrogenase (short-subunit alcohol dehydrogenase family)